MTPRTAVAGLLTAGALVLFAGCSAGPTPQAVPLETGQPAAVTGVLDGAVSLVNSTRKPVLDGPGVVGGVAMALDAADEAGGAGDDARATSARRGAALERARAAVAATPEQVTAYEQALGALRVAAAPLAAEQEQALLAVAQAGAAEASAATAFAGAAGAALPAYEALDAALVTWVQRSSDGWYRSAGEGAAAYAVLVRPQQDALSQAREGLRRADAARRAATDRQRAALSAAEQALTPLRAPTGELPGG